LGEQHLLFLFSTLFAKMRKAKFEISASSAYVVPESAAVACTCGTEQCLSLWQLVYVVAAALAPIFR
jgi:hypothetical protein